MQYVGVEFNIVLYLHGQFTTLKFSHLGSPVLHCVDP